MDSANIAVFNSILDSITEHQTVAIGRDYCIFLFILRILLSKTTKRYLFTLSTVWVIEGRGMAF